MLARTNVYASVCLVLINAASLGLLSAQPAQAESDVIKLNYVNWRRRLMMNYDKLDKLGTLCSAEIGADYFRPLDRRGEI